MTMFLVLAPGHSALMAMTFVSQSSSLSRESPQRGACSGDATSGLLQILGGKFWQPWRCKRCPKVLSSNDVFD